MINFFTGTLEINAVYLLFKTLMHTSVTIRVVPYSVNIVSGFYRRCGAEFFGGIEPELKNKIPTCQYQYYWSRSREFEIPKKTTKVTRLCKGGGFSQGPIGTLSEEFYFVYNIWQDAGI